MQLPPTQSPALSQPPQGAPWPWQVQGCTQAPEHCVLSPQLQPLPTQLHEQGGGM